MEVLRTPDARFISLPDFSFAPHYLEVGTPPLRLHYLDEGDSGAAPQQHQHECADRLSAELLNSGRFHHGPSPENV